MDGDSIQGYSPLSIMVHFVDFMRYRDNPLFNRHCSFRTCGTQGDYTYLVAFLSFRTCSLL
jgi:hypothetical protein